MFLENVGLSLNLPFGIITYVNQKSPIKKTKKKMKKKNLLELRKRKNNDIKLITMHKIHWEYIKTKDKKWGEHPKPPTDFPRSPTSVHIYFAAANLLFFPQFQFTPPYKMPYCTQQEHPIFFPPPVSYLSGHLLHIFAKRGGLGKPLSASFFW